MHKMFTTTRLEKQKHPKLKLPHKARRPPHWLVWALATLATGGAGVVLVTVALDVHITAVLRLVV